MKILFLFLALTTAITGLQGQQAEHPAGYEYLTIVSDSRRPNEIYTSGSDGSYEKFRVEVAGRFDYSEILKLIHSKEAEGYELYDSSFSTIVSDVTSPHNYFLLRRPVSPSD